MDTNNINNINFLSGIANQTSGVNNQEPTAPVPTENAEKPKKRRRKPGKVITLAEEPEISFEVDESQPDNNSSSVNTASPVKKEDTEKSDDLPEEQSGNITF